jgi:ribosomal protein S18 acetylase RimI-like enzyme
MPGLPRETPEAQPPPQEPLRLREMDWRRDREAVLRFQYETYETNFPGFTVTEEFLQDFSDQLRRALRSRWEHVLVLADQQDQVYGFLWLSLISTMVDEWVGYIKNVYVAPELRGRGYARMMLAAADEWFQFHNISKASLDASACNRHAVDLYLKSGYQIARLRLEKRY